MIAMVKQSIWPTIKEFMLLAREKMEMESSKLSTLALKQELISRYLTSAADLRRYWTADKEQNLN
jgi:hypothetical protein